jgi:methionyl-tRNA formyltransferase
MAGVLRIAFMGTPYFVVPTAQALLDSRHDLVCIYTQPPREKGRKRQIEETPVHRYGEGAGIEVRHPGSFKSADDVKAFEDLDLDVAIVAAYGMLLPEVILKAPKHGCINIHPSLLPRWRGPSPVQYALWKGDKETGVSIMSLDKGMDTGPVLAQESTDTAGKNFDDLNLELWKTGTRLLMDVLDDLAETGELKKTPQSSEGVTYCKLLTKEQGHIDWTQSAHDIDLQIRSLNPWPGTWCLTDKGKRLRIYEAQPQSYSVKNKPGTILESGSIVCGKDTVLLLKTVQPENKNAMDIKSALNGGFLEVGSVLK